MSGALSKRQQARNEKLLHELVQNVPGNNQCADCHARNPAWASWSLGVFLCMRCAAIHRKLGTHISKVKSLSMDSWSNEQVDNMRKVGNATSNKIYNPQNKKPPVPIDADEADSAMERFIRQKYMNNSVSSARRHDTGSTESDETPPPLPPKPQGRFGFRSASSIFPLSHRAKKDAAAAASSPASSRRPPPSPRDFHDHSPDSPRNKASKVFGASVQYDSQEDTERKLAKIRDMGFQDEQRNSMVLKGMNGSLEKTVEALVRLGEGDGRTPGLSLAIREHVTPLKRSLTPASGLSVPLSAGATSPTTNQTTSPTRSPSSTNPFDMLDMPPAQPQSSQSTGTLQTRNPYNTGNPFGVSHQQQGFTLDQALQNLSLAPSQPLFPHHTGGVPGQAGQPLGQVQTQQQLMTTPMPTPVPMPMPMSMSMSMSMPMPMSAVPQNMAPFTFNNSQTYPPPVQQPMQTGYNPFFTNPSSQLQPTPQPSLSLNTTSSSFSPYGNNPFFAKSPTRIQSPSILTQIPEQSAQQNFYSSPGPVQQPWAASPASLSPAMFNSPSSGVLPQASNNPFLVQQQPQPPLPQQQQQQQKQQPQIQQHFQTPVVAAATATGQPQMLNTASFLSMYSQKPDPFSVPATSLNATMSWPQQQQQHQQQQPQQLQQQQQQQQQQEQQPQQPLQNFAVQPPMRAMTSPPMVESRNPFLSPSSPAHVQAAQPAVPASAVVGGGRSRDSMMAMGMEWSNGRHSPDAFASLSARH